MYRLLLIGVFIITNYCKVLPQSTADYKEIDRLKRAANRLTDTPRIKAFNDISRRYIIANNRDSALYYATLAGNEAKRIQYAHGLAIALSLQARISRVFDENFSKSDSLAKTALDWFDRSPHQTGIDSLYNVLWDLHYIKTQFDEAINYLQKSYQYYKKAGNQQGMWDVIEMLAWTYTEAGDYEKGFHYERLVYQNALKTNDTIKIYFTLFGLGELHKQMEDYSTAQSYFRRAKQFETQKAITASVTGGADIWGKTFYAESFCHLKQFDSAWHYYQLLKPKETDPRYRIYLISSGECHFLEGNYQQALQNFLQGLQQHYQLNDRSQIMRSLIDIAKTYAALANDTAAIRYARLGLYLAQETQAKQNIRNAYEVLYKAYDRLNEKDSAYKYLIQYITLKEIVSGAQIKGKLVAFQFEQEIALLNKEKEVQAARLQRVSLMKNLVSAGAFVLVIFGLILFRIVMLKRKNDQHRRELAENELQIQKLQSEKKWSELKRQKAKLKMQALRAQMNPHFIFNCLNAINHFILKNEAEKASDYLTKFSRLVRLVLQTSTQKAVTLHDEMETLRYYIELEQMRFQKHFTYQINHDPDLDTESITLPPLLLQPFVENAIWHGLMHNEKAGTLSISLNVRENMLHCTITDNGIGRRKAAALKSQSASLNKSLGLQITTDRLKMLNKEHDQASFLQIIDKVDEQGEGCGTEVRMAIPVKIK